MRKTSKGELCESIKKIVFFCLVLIIIAQSFFILALMKENKNGNAAYINYYGGSSAIDIELIATKDYYLFKNSAVAEGIYPEYAKLPQQDKGKVFLLGRIFIYDNANIKDPSEGTLTLSTGKKFINAI